MHTAHSLNSALFDMNFLSSFFSRGGYLAHGYCFTWTPSLLWSMVGADAVIAAAYFSIPLAIASFIHRRGDSSLNWVAGMFSVFIFACGITHVMDIWTIWQPDYGLQAIAKMLTAAVSLVTAIALWPLIPQALKTPAVGQLETESNRVAAIVESSSDAIIGTTLQGRITSWNHGAQSMFGYTAQEAVGQPVQMLIPADREVEEMRILAELSNGRRVPAFDTLRRAKDGTLLDISLTISPVRDFRGNIVGGAKIARNVSEQRRAETALRKSQLRLRFILDAAQIGEWESDLATGAVTRSVQHDRCFGYEQLVPDWNADTFMAHLHPEDRAEVERKTRDFLKTANEWNYECRVVWPDRSIHWIRMNGSTIRDGDKPVRLIGIIADITRQKLAEESRLRSLQLENRQIQEANRLKSLFLANMSHELRTPLNAIIGFADLLHSGAIAPTSAKYPEFLGYIGTSGRHLLQLINDVLDLSKVESGKLEFFPEWLNLPGLIKEVSDLLHPAIQRKRIQLNVDVDPALTDLFLDPGRLKQALFNYLSNAIKFTPEGGRVSVRALREDSAHLRIEVDDTGIGIAAADLPRLFSEFQQLDAGLDKQHEGTGLGLALTRRLIEAQSGTVGATSVVGRGSVFHLVLNRVHGTDQKRGEPDAEESQKRRLLVIDEDHAHYVAALTDAGFAVDTPATGEQAVQYAERHNYDGITLNLELPDESGLGVLSHIRSHGASRESPVVGVSMPAVTGEAATFAIADVLTKPLRTDELLTAMAPFRIPAARRAKIMVIDDDPASLELMRATLAGIGLESVCIASGLQALRELDQHRPDAIILDLMMPEFDGFAVLDALHSMRDWRNTPVFVWTSMALTETEYARLAKSAHAILSKGGGAFAAMLDDLRRRYPPLGGLQSKDAVAP
jgi:PAS domain S-box-containing protein